MLQPEPNQISTQPFPTTKAREATIAKIVEVNKMLPLICCLPWAFHAGPIVNFLMITSMPYCQINL